MSARGRRGGACSHGRGRGRGGGGRGSSMGPLKPPSSPALLAVKHCARIEMNAPGMVLPHHTDFGLGEGVAFPEADLLGPVAVGGMTLRNNITAAVGVPAATQGLPCVRCLRYWREVPFSACHILVRRMACIRCRHDTQHVCHPVSWQLFVGPLRSLGRREFSLTLGRCLLCFALLRVR